MKTTKEEIKQICNNLNLTYVDHGDVPIIINNKKKQIYVRFICNIHQKYGVQEKSLMDLKRLNKPCKYCNHSMLKITFKEELREISPEIEVLSDYVNWNTKIKCRCTIHNYEWDGNVSTLLYGGKCKLCGNQKRWDSRGRKTTSDIINELAIINPDIEIISEYNGAHKLIKCRCKIDGKEWESYVCNLLNKSAECPECSAKRIREIESLSDEDINNRIHSHNKHIDYIGNYRNNKSQILCRCNLHDIEFTACAKNLLYLGGNSCPKCSQSLGERKMNDVLEGMGYTIEPQYEFQDCKYINTLRFDGYDKMNNVAFEYQGQQHYYPVDFSGKNDGTAEEQFRLNKIRDNIKREYCQSNNIKLIEIPYWEYDNMESFLYEKLK